MKLYWSPASPYVRKVMAAAIARGVEGGIEPVFCDPHASPAELVAANPLSKIPCLVAADGVPLFDSPVICEYLDTLGDAPPLVPPAGASRVRVLLMQAMADGILDAAVSRRGMAALPQDEGRQKYDARQGAVVARTLALLEDGPPAGLDDLGAIAVGCALGYLDFRYAHEPWRAGHPRLMAWFAGVAPLPPLARTVPMARAA